MMPQEVGYAAAYEAYRQLKYSGNVYNNLYTDNERQHEALRGLAVAEGVSLSIVPFFLTPHVIYHFTKAARLWQDVGRGYDQFGLQTACDAAAATAGNISIEREMEESQGYGSHGGGSFRNRRSSFGGYAGSGYAGSGYAGSSYGGGGSAYGGSPLMLGGNLPGTPRAVSPIPIPGSPYLGGGVPYAGSGGMPGSYGSGYAGSYGAPGYDHFGLPNAGYQIGGGYPMSAPGTPAAVIIHQPESRHRHRHRHSSHRHRRHRSHDRY